MISFALGELNCPSLDYVYRMSWAEFNLRLFSYKRMNEGEMIKLRRLAWITYIAPHQDPKKLRGLREERWWKIGENRPQISESHRQRFTEEMVKYLAKTKHGTA